MGVYIVTGLKGQEHVTSADDGAFNAGIVGTGKYVMKTAEQFAAEIVSNNIVRIKSGDLVNQGRHIRIEVNDYEDMTIENGAQSVKRNDLIVMRYKKDTSTTIELESAELVVIKGIAGATATDPTYTSGDILAGATQDDFPLYRVSLNGLNIEKVTPLFSTVPNLNELNTKITKMDDGNYRHIKVATTTVSNTLADLGAAYAPLRYYKMFEVDWDSFLPTGKKAKEVIFSHVTISGYNGEYATCTPYLKNGDTVSQQQLPTQWALWCSKNAYCYPTFFILY